DARGVAQCVLRDRPLIPRDRQATRLSADFQDFAQIVVDYANQFFVAYFYRLRVGRPADEIGQANPAFRRAPGEKRRVPDRTQRPQAFAARREEAKAVEFAGYLLDAISKRNRHY